MPPPHEILTDDYVADLLAKEAGDCSLKYSTMGLDAFKSNKRPANQPKPNTRFLNNIIRDTNSHNRALLAKENAESQARLREMEQADRKKREEERQRERRSKPGLGDTRKRMLGDIAAILGGPLKKSKRNDGSGTISSAKRARSESHSDEDRARQAKRRELGRPSDGDMSRRRDRTDDRHSKSRDSHERSYRRRERSRDRSRDRGIQSRDERDDRRRREKEHRREKEDSRHRRHRSEKKETRRATRSESRDRDSDSDPLDDIIGPVPASKSTVRRRGRGLNAAMSGIDSRFAADYDPTADVTPDPDDAGNDDWDNAVETFRDRQKWKQQGADRLRSAGFTEDQVRKWEKGDTKDESDVRWNKAGDVREWDRQKVVDLDDDASLKPEFGRLKGT